MPVAALKVANDRNILIAALTDLPRAVIVTGTYNTAHSTALFRIEGEYLEGGEIYELQIKETDMGRVVGLVKS